MLLSRGAHPTPARPPCPTPSQQPRSTLSIPTPLPQDDDIQGNGPWSAISEATTKAITAQSDKLIAYADADERAELAGYTGSGCDKPTIAVAGCEQAAKVGKNFALQVSRRDHCFRRRQGLWEWQISWDASGATRTDASIYASHLPPAGQPDLWRHNHRLRGAGDH